MSIQGFLNEFDEVVAHLEKTWPRHGIYNPGEYGFDAVRRWQETAAHADLSRADLIRKIAMELLKIKHNKDIIEDLERRVSRIENHFPDQDIVEE